MTRGIEKHNSLYKHRYEKTHPIHLKITPGWRVKIELLNP